MHAKIMQTQSIKLQTNHIYIHNSIIMIWNNDFYGYIAAFVGAISIGSYGVPIKAITLDIPDVHPFVIQTYKTCVFFTTSWVVYFFFKQLEEQEQDNNNNKTSTSIDFTYWGFLSGFLFVTGGTCGIYAIRNAGIAVAVGTWASIIVCVNFTWGILIFQEPIRSFWESCVAFVLLISGLVGMSKYSSPSSSSSTTINNDSSAATDEETVELIETTPLKKKKNENYDNDIEQEPVISPILTNRNNVTMSRVSSMSLLNDDNGDDDTVGSAAVKEEIDKKKEVRMNDNIIFYYYIGSGGTDTTTATRAASIIRISKRQLGIVCAVLNGILGGSCLVPLHYAKEQGFTHIVYILSFGTGSLVANIVLWVLYFLWVYYYITTTNTTNTTTTPQQQQQQQQQNSDSSKNNETTTTATSTVSSNSYTAASAALDSMPTWYFHILWKRGACAGLLLTIGMYSSIIAVSLLGQGVGNSLTQSKILISGLWGIYYYKEITDKKLIFKWFVSAMVCICGIVLLSYERLTAIKT